MSEKKCPECGGNIIMKYMTPTKIFSIGNNKQFKRIDQNVVHQPAGDNSYLVFDCENDAEHDISTSDILEWVEELEKLFYDEGYYE